MPQQSAKPSAWKYLSFLLIVVCLVELWAITSLWRQLHPSAFQLRVDDSAPLAASVKKQLRSTRYTGTPSLLRPEVTLGIDPEDASWALNNFYEYDKQAHILLEAQQYGLCQMLVAFYYNRLKNQFDPDRYEVQSLAVKESSYFPAPWGNHIVLEIKDKHIQHPFKGTYILDPSFRRYQNITAFDDYQFEERQRIPELCQRPTTHLVQSAGKHTPLSISKNHILLFGVNPYRNRFDREHFELQFITYKQYKYNSAPMILIRREGDSITVIEDKKLCSQLLKPAEHALIKKKMLQLANNARSQQHQSVDSNTENPM